MSVEILERQMLEKVSKLRAVKKFLRSRLIMSSRRLWNSHQRQKFLRAEASRDILKFRVLEMVFPGVFQEVVSTRLGRTMSKCTRCSTTLDDSNVLH